MRNDESYGIIALRRGLDGLEVFLIHQAAGHWGFPKGHKDPGETHLDAAKRELTEETGLVVEEILSFDPFMENFQFELNGEWIDKFVWYYPATVKGVVSLDQPREVVDAKWVSIKGALSIITFPEAKRIAYDIAASEEEYLL